jgi:hypothetical protein
LHAHAEEIPPGYKQDKKRKFLTGYKARKKFPDQVWIV